MVSDKKIPAVALSHQDGHHSAVALLLKAALIQVSDYRLLGASCLPVQNVNTVKSEFPEFILPNTFCMVLYTLYNCTAVQLSWSEGGITRHNFGRGPSNDYFIKAWFQLSNWFQTRRFLCEFPLTKMATQLYLV
jgi:hypothetical protein